MMITQREINEWRASKEHFVVTERPGIFKPGDTVRARRDENGKLLGLDKARMDDGTVIQSIVGYVSGEGLLDDRCMMAVTVDGVTLWRTY